MSLIQATTGKGAPTVDDGLYEVVCTAVEDITLPAPDQFGKTEKVRISIQLVGEEDEEGEPIILDPLVNRTFGQKATLRAWASAFLSMNVEDNQWFELEDLIGHHAQALIKTEIVDGKRGWPKVTNLLAMPKPKERKSSYVTVGNETDAEDEAGIRAHGAKAVTKAVERPQPSLQEEAELTAWWRHILGQGHDRAAVVELSEGMFEGRAPGELKADERAELEKAIV